MNPQVFAFAKIDGADSRQKVYHEIQNGKSRFGMWSQRKSLREEWHGANAILLKINAGDWIVHVNMPSYGQCVAVKTTGTYQFDQGLVCDWGADFNNYLPVDPKTIVEFDRNNPNILPSVNLAPRRRAQRIYEVQDFLTSLENIKTGRFDSISQQDKGVIHLQEKVSNLLPQITSQIHKMNRSKELERFLHRIFESMPNTLSIQNGFGFGTDHGTDLIVEFESPIIGINLRHKVIVQAKSFEGQHLDLHAVDQIVIGIQQYDADAGLLITTGEETEELEAYMRRKSEEIGKTIDLMAGADVARFVLRYAPELLI